MRRWRQALQVGTPEISFCKIGAEEVYGGVVYKTSNSAGFASR